MEKITLTEEQQSAFDALRDFAEGRTGAALAVLEGFAGTGKTTVVAELLGALAGLCVACMAPTNKAVAVLQAKAAGNAEFGSVHSFLGLRLTENEDGTQKCLPEGRCTLHDYDFAIVDECSMVSESLFREIVQSKRGCRVLFVGDPAQLPPVEDGKESPVFRMIANKQRLVNIVRQAAENPIIAASLVVRRDIEAARRACIADLVEAFGPPPSSAGVMSGGMESIIAVLISEHAAGRQCRGIAWTNPSVIEINRRVHGALFPGCATPFAVGESVIAQSEFRSMKEGDFRSARVFNSEEMMVQSIEPANHPSYPLIPSLRVTLRRDSEQDVTVFIPENEREVQRRISLLWNDYRAAKRNGDRDAKNKSNKAWDLTRAFAPIRHVYAMTAHKSQGSTFDTALLYWDDMMRQRSDFEFNRMIYVAMTRAAKFMAIVTE
ncbi:MAG: AAA family ATPase [Candidatus Accumulibacter sp.]|nr:AAA family ATPase [Accumulibacter sp.]